MQQILSIYLILGILVNTVALLGFSLYSWHKTRGKLRLEIVRDGDRLIGYYPGVDGRLQVYEGGKGTGNKAFNPRYTPTCFDREKYWLGLRTRKVLKAVWGADSCIDYGAKSVSEDGKTWETPVPKYNRATIRTWLEGEFFDLFKTKGEKTQILLIIAILMLGLILLKTWGILK